LCERCGGLDGAWGCQCLSGYSGHWVCTDVLGRDGGTPIDGGGV